MRAGLIAISMALLTSLVVGCQQPSQSVAPIPGTSPAASPVAPAIQPLPTGPEQPIELPASGEPVAPAIEPEPTGPEPTIEFDPG